MSQESGLVSLVTVLGFHDIAADPQQLSREFATPDGHFDSAAIVRSARSKGLKARATRSTVRRISRLPLPAILILKSGAHVILAKTAGGSVLVKEANNPPAEWTLQGLSDVWAGEVILFARRAARDNSGTIFGLSWFVPVVMRYKTFLLEVLLASLFIQIFALISPMISQVVIDKVLVHRGLSTLDVLAIAILIISFFEVTLGGLRTYVFSHTASRIDAQLGARLFQHLLNLPISYFESRPTGQTVARLRELESVREFLTSSALTLTIDLAFTVIFFVVMYFYSPTLTYVVLASLPLYFGLSIALTPALKRRVEERFERGAINQSFLVETVAGVETLKAMAVEPQMRHRWEETLAAYVKASFRMISLGSFGAQVVTLINKVVMAALLWFGARLAIQGEITIGELVAFNMLAGQVNTPILRLAQLWQDFQQFRISIDRLGDILNTRTESDTSATHPNLPPIAGNMRFESVTFRYRPGLPEVLRDLTVEIKAGEVVGIVGRSGSGKSTLTKLLQRMHVPERGRVLVDGIDIALLDPGWLRRQIGVVLQENVLFNRTVRDNIALAEPAMDMERVIAAAQLAAAHEFILQLPQGYDTVLEERGSNLSGGQRQRLAIARALATNPRVLVFDEATSALDYESEAIIQNNMREICHGRTVFLVAHRLSTVRRADRILVMDKAMLIEQGSHDELVKRGGLYAELVRQSMG
jgi:ATP-binding cassette, subfamily B, bacterial HlyB/CyaB